MKKLILIFLLVIIAAGYVSIILKENEIERVYIMDGGK